MNKESNLWFFKNVDLYELLCPRKVSLLEDKYTIHHYRKNDYIYFENDPSQNIYLIASGRVKIGSVREDGKEIIDKKFRVRFVPLIGDHGHNS